MRKSLFCSAAAVSVLLGLSLSAKAADLPMARSARSTAVYTA